ncbi:MAG: hypothetical protein RJQ10_04520 [Haliea sp.]
MLMLFYHAKAAALQWPPLALAFTPATESLNIQFLAVMAILE